MKQAIFEIKDNKNIARDVFKIELCGDTSGITAPGQFVNIKLDGFYLRRPLSVCDVADGTLTLIYKTVGRGTRYLSTLKHKETLDILTGLGNGYDTSKSGSTPLLIGGGVGVPPLYLLAKKLVSQGKTSAAVLGFGSADDIFLQDELEALGVKVYITTIDGSYGEKGIVTDIIKRLDYSYFYACGPEAMLRALCENTKTSGQLSFEERMGCGFGACMGCSCMTLTGAKRICKEGPVLEKEEIIWPTQK